MLCERSYDPLSRMLLKGDEGGCKIRRGGGRKWRFSPGGSFPLDDLSVTSNRDSSLGTSAIVHSAIHERAVLLGQARPTLANAAWENQKRPSARRVSPARVVQIQRTTPHPNSALPRSSHFGLVGCHGASGYSSLRRPHQRNNHSNSKDRRRTSHALASPLGGAGSAMLFSVAAAI